MKVPVRLILDLRSYCKRKISNQLTDKFSTLRTFNYNSRPECFLTSKRTVLDSRTEFCAGLQAFNQKRRIGDVFVRKYYLLLTAHGTPEDNNETEDFKLLLPARLKKHHLRERAVMQMAASIPRNRMFHIFGGESTPQCLHPRKSDITFATFG